MPYKAGDVVQQVVKPIVGPVVDLSIANGEVHYLVEWTDGEGNSSQRWFNEGEIEAAETAETK